MATVAATGQDVALQIRPEAIYVENIGGNIVPMERVFFHVVLENKSGAPIEVQWLRFDMVNSQGVVLSGQYSGKALMGLFDSAIDRKRIEPTPKETLVLEAGQRKAISDIFMDFPTGFIGENLMVEVDYKSAGQADLRKASTPLRRGQGFLGHLPFEGVWYVEAAHDFVDSHKRFLAETFAYDFIQVGANGKSFRREGRTNSDYLAYGQRVLAAKEGIVVSVRNDIVENVPGEPNTTTPGGNLVIINHGDNQYGYYGHLKPGSIKVRPGSSVRTGDPIGDVGNSGDSLEPNLHFHVMNNQDPTQADGTPVIFENWKAQSYSRSPVVRSQGIIPRGEFVQP
ncbi:MAG TPA: M23 family metallopeptidase [Terriglobia bacterium]|nr:M23 family metallopeptidase [Terriglobia bacterium]